jgi:putative peptidoglycan lipid II flippase
VIAAVVWGLMSLNNGGRSDGSGRIITGTVASAFDPVGGDGEHNAEAHLAVDGNPETAWSTESYRDPDLAAPGNKGGVGLIVRLPASASLRQVDLTSRDDGWSATIYAVSGASPSKLAGWGTPLASVDRAPSGTTHLVVTDPHADAVLVWLTRLPTRGTFALGEVAVRAR